MKRRMRCDCHVHIVGTASRYPQVVDRTYLADVATLKQLEAASAPRAIRRFVIVQPSFYGTDNSLLLEALAELGGRGRGVAVVNPETISARTLATYADQGIRGVRLNLYSPLRDRAPLSRRFADVVDLARGIDWHIEVIAPLEILVENAALLASSRVPIVIDHYGLYAGFQPGQGEGRALLELVALPHIWIKLSAPYRVSANHLATRPDPAWLAAILMRSSERCVWGSDWPHTPPHHEHAGSATISPYRNLRYAALVDDFIDAVGSDEQVEKTLSDNPTRLYGFE